MRRNATLKGRCVRKEKEEKGKVKKRKKKRVREKSLMVKHMSGDDIVCNR